MKLIKEIDIIIIDNGDVFEGTKDQFADCFFSNVTYSNIKKWCKQNGFSFKIKERKLK